MWKLAKISIALALMAVSVLTPLALWHRAQTVRRECEASLRERDLQLSALSVENQRLSNLVISAETSALPAPEISELLRLRGQIGQLRRTVAEANTLAVRNRQLATAVSNAEVAPQSSLPPEPQNVQAYWPRTQLGFAGYSEPTAALKTTLWAMAQADTNVLAGSVTPEVKTKMLRENWYDHGSTAEELASSARRIADSLRPASGFYVVGQRAISQEQVVLDVFFEGEGRTRKFAMKKIGEEWKFNALGRAAAGDDDVHPGYSAWP